ncbi:MAG: SusC/RagA family TonB-linked outer membrane protein [Bacteroidales bacterium]
MKKIVQLTLLLLMIPVVLFAQKMTVKGSVLDKSKEPLIGASVVLKGTDQGTITDYDGNYVIQAAKGDILVISYIGYNPKDVTVSSNVMNVVLDDNTVGLDEVVVVGYGTVRKSDLTGAVGTVKAGEAIKGTPTGNVGEALQGRMAGVSVVSGSGDPNSDMTIRVRGVNSINAESGPLVVIDGFIGGSLKSLNPSDIQSIEVLKDASATAVYGSRGANGVILVTTKNPQKDKMVLTVNSFVNFKTLNNRPDMLSPGEFARLANDYGNEYNASQGKKPVQYYTPDQIAAFDNGTEGFDYIKGTFRDMALSQNHEISLSGGSEKITFLASLRYEGNEGVIKNSKAEQFNYRLKLDADVKKWMKIGLNFWGDYAENYGPRMTAYEGLLMSAINFPNTMNPYDKDGNYNNKFAVNGGAAYNPMGMVSEVHGKNRALTNRLQGYVDFTILDGLTFRSQLGITFINQNNTSMDNSKSYYYFKNSMTQASAYSSSNIGFLNTNILNYTKEFNKDHRINATAVFEQTQSNTYWHRSKSSNLMFDDILGSDALDWADDFQNESARTITALMSGMLRLNYVFKNRYMLTASIRADGSSNLEHKWAYFPSVALAWDMKQEGFMQDISYIDQLKLRVGYGSVGNQSVPAYRTYSKMSPVRNPDGTTSYVIDRPAAPDLKWERNNQINAGVDVSFLNGRATASVDVYDKLSKDILLEVQQPDHTGWPSLLKNAGEIRNRGIEVTLGGNPVQSRGWNWRTDLTLSHNKGTFEKIPTLNKMQSQAGKYENEIFKMIEGEKLGTFWGYYYDGVWTTADVNANVTLPDGSVKTNGQYYGVVPGQAKYKDLNGDGVINNDDMGVIGNGQPTFNWGWNNNVTYKNVDLSVFIVGYHGFDIYNATRESRNGCKFFAGDNITPNPELLDRWTPENENTNVPGFVYVKKPVTGFSSRYVEKGDFIKVKSITLGYSVPQSVCSKWRINSLRVYGSVQNPFQITKYEGIDPEVALGNPLTQGVDWGYYPNGRNIIVGLNFSF